MIKKLSADEARLTFPPEQLPFDTTESIEPVKGIVGQARALDALQFGLGVHNSGFNVFVAGPTGTGKMSAVAAFLEEAAQQKPVPPDWIYVNNFEDSYRPKAIRLNPGMGVRFQKDMKSLIETARDEVTKAFESEDYTRRRDQLTSSLSERRQKVLAELNQEARQKGFAIQASPMGILLIPLSKGRPMEQDEILSMSPQDREKMNRRQEDLRDAINSAMQQMRRWESDVGEEIEKLDRQVVEYVLGSRIEELSQKYGADNADIRAYLKALQDDIVENKDLFRFRPEAEGNPFVRMQATMALRKYEVNVLIDNSKSQGAPVIIEHNPTFNNLVGRLEKETYFGAITGDFTMIRPGSLHKANGGYLVLRTDDLNLLAWDSLKRALRERKITIEDIGERFGFISIKSIQPEPIPLDAKIILVGENLFYYALHYYDRDFPELFKVKAEFDSRMDRDKDNINRYTSALCLVCGKEELRHLDRSAVAKILEHSSRMAEDQQKLSAKFSDIADIIREASYWAGARKSEVITAEDISKSINEKIYRSNLIQDRIREMIERGLLKIRTEGEVVGQVNGLSVMFLGDLYFGRPNRITASIAAGREGVMDIEREAKLGGPIHTKGVLILSGFLSERYATNIPLTLAARLVFEQSYEGVEGDSASSAELYSLLSALADAPIKQGFAVTGSVNQKGEVQAIGGVNYKIEGFYDICKVRGLTGNEAVIIPESNVQNLMLREDVVEAVRKGEFSVYSVSTIDEGIELLTGIKAGLKLEEGKWEEGTINKRVQDKLEHFAKRMRDFSRGPEEGRPREKEEALAAAESPKQE